MKQIQLTNWEAAKIGLLLSAGVGCLLLIIWPASRDFTVFGVPSLIMVFPLSIIGGLVGKFLSRTRQGVWISAAIMIFLWWWWIYTIVSNLPLD